MYMPLTPLLSINKSSMLLKSVLVVIYIFNNHRFTLPKYK